MQTCDVAFSTPLYFSQLLPYRLSLSATSRPVWCKQWLCACSCGSTKAVQVGARQQGRLHVCSKHLQSATILLVDNRVVAASNVYVSL